MQRASRNRIFSVVILCLAEMGLLYSAPHGTTGGRPIETLASVRPWHAMALQQGPRLARPQPRGAVAARQRRAAAARPRRRRPVSRRRPTAPRRPTRSWPRTACPATPAGTSTSPATPDIQGFATEISVNRGESISFKVDTPRVRLSPRHLPHGLLRRRGRAQGGHDPAVGAAAADAAAVRRPSSSTGLVDCGNWGVSASWTVPADGDVGDLLRAAACARTRTCRCRPRATSSSSSATTAASRSCCSRRPTRRGRRTTRTAATASTSAIPTAAPTRSATTVR